MAVNKPGGDLIFFPGLTVAPGLRLMQGDNFVMTLSTPLSFGLSGRTISYFGIDVPAMIDVSFGSAAGNTSHSKVGVVLGAGWAYLYAENVSTDLSTGVQGFSSADFYGPRVQVGLSFASGGDRSAPMVMFSYGASASSSGVGFGRGSGGSGQVIGVSLQLVMGSKRRGESESSSGN